MSRVDPPYWTREQLEASSAIAVSTFRRTRLEEPLEQYLDAFDEARASFEDLLEATVDLSQLRRLASTVLGSADLQEAARYLAGPPISVDDLKKVADVASLAASKLRTNRTEAEGIIDVIIHMLDRRRFPWLSEDREPDPSERDAAILASAAMLAMRRAETARRGAAKRSQEGAVADRLNAAGFLEVARRKITSHQDAPKPGEWCGETHVGTRQADLVVGLWDGRILAVECKVSNSEVNSFKRLNNDAAQKAVVWLKEFGERSIVPVAVLTGVFKVDNLSAAQKMGLSLFWEHDLDEFDQWVERTRT